MADKILLEIVTPEKTVLSEMVDVAVAPGELGEFGVLANHIPFLAKLKIGELRFRVGNTTRHVTTMGGYAEVLPDRVTILTPAAEEAVDIDVIRAKAARERAEQRLRETRDQIAFLPLRPLCKERLLGSKWPRDDPEQRPFEQHEKALPDLEGPFVFLLSAQAVIMSRVFHGAGFGGRQILGFFESIMELTYVWNRRISWTGGLC